MNPLSTEIINKLSPYTFVQISESDWIFDTDYGVSYNVGFDEDCSIWEENAYQFYIVNTNQKSSPRDEKLKKAVLCLIDEFFRVNPDILLYICDTGDNKQHARNRLFKCWFDSSRKDKYLLTSAVVRAEGVDNYASVLVQRSNPEANIIIQQFKDFVEFLSDKPE